MTKIIYPLTALLSLAICSFLLSVCVKRLLPPERSYNVLDVVSVFLLLVSTGTLVVGPIIMLCFLTAP